MIIIRFTIILVTLLFIQCSEDESNPAAPSSVGTYIGNNNMDKSVSFVISNKSGRAFVTEYSIEYEYALGAFTQTGEISHSDSDGIVEVTNNRFTIDLSTDPEDQIEGKISGSNLEGSFKIVTGTTIGGEKQYVSGTYTAFKEDG
ncbi:hypothetical protein ACFLS9_06800 [Bacteroidota bacterium]